MRQRFISQVTEAYSRELGGLPPNSSSNEFDSYLAKAKKEHGALRSFRIGRVLVTIENFTLLAEVHTVRDSGRYFEAVQGWPVLKYLHVERER